MKMLISKLSKSQISAKLHMMCSGESHVPGMSIYHLSYRLQTGNYTE